MKMNPEALHLMIEEYIAMTYKKYNNYLAKLNGYIVPAIDGSDIIPPFTKNAKKYGVNEPLGRETTGESYDELLLTSFTQDDFSLEGIKKFID